MQQSFRVVHLISSGGFYGAERVVLDLCLAGIGENVRPLVACFNDLRKPHIELYEAARNAGIAAHLIECKSQIDFLAFQQIKKVLERERADILHCHGFKADFYGFFCKMLLKTTIVATSHLWTASRPLFRFYERVDALCLRFFDHIAAVSVPIHKDLVRSGIDPASITIVPNGIHFRSQKDEGAGGTQRSKLGLKPGEIAIGCIARLSPEKGHRHLLHAAKSVLEAMPHARFVLFGDGPMRGKLEEEAATLSLREAVLFAGFRDDMDTIYPLLDLVVSSSYREGLPMSLLEAASYGIPIIATPVGDVAELIEDGVSGILVKPGDEAGLAGTIVSLLKAPDRMREMGRRGKERVEARFSARRMVRDYAAIYRKVTEGARATSM